jgi:hypothetical protein
LLLTIALQRGLAPEDGLCWVSIKIRTPVLAGWCPLSGLSVEEIEASRHGHSSDLRAEFAVTLARKVAVTHADVSEDDM